MLSRVFPYRFVPVLLATLLLASLLPVRGGAVPVAQAVSTAAIIFLFFLNGVRVPRDEVRHGIRNWKLQGGALVFCFGFMALRSEEHTSELQSLMRISYAVFCLKKKNKNKLLII